MADRKIEHLKEQIKFETELLRFTAVAVLAVGGGSLSLLLGDSTPLRLSLAGVGLLGTLALVGTGWRLERRTRALIAQITEDQ